MSALQPWGAPIPEPSLEPPEQEREVCACCGLYGFLCDEHGRCEDCYPEHCVDCEACVGEDDLVDAVCSECRTYYEDQRKRREAKESVQ